MAEFTEENIKAWLNGDMPLRNLQNLTDDEVNALTHLGYILFQQGKLQEARGVFEALIALDPSKDYFYRALGGVFLKLGQLDLALQQFSNSIELNTSVPHTYVNRAEVYIAQKNYEAAKVELDAALQKTNPKEAGLSKKIWAMKQVLKQIVQ